MNRKLLNVKDVLIIVLLLAAAFGTYLLRGSRGEASYAVITLDGAVSVSESGCSDRVCVRTGAVSHMGEAIICVPNKVAVTVESSESGLDVVLR